MDTGSLKSDFIAPDIAQELIQNGATMRKVRGGHLTVNTIVTLVTFNIKWYHKKFVGGYGPTS